MRTIRSLQFEAKTPLPPLRLSSANQCLLLENGTELTAASSRYIPGHLHAFYLEYVYYDRREQAREGRFASGPAPGIYSDNVQTGGGSYGTIVEPTR